MAPCCFFSPLFSPFSLFFSPPALQQGPVASNQERLRGEFVAVAALSIVFPRPHRVPAFGSPMTCPVGQEEAVFGDRRRCFGDRQRCASPPASLPGTGIPQSAPSSPHASRRAPAGVLHLPFQQHPRVPARGRILAPLPPPKSSLLFTGASPNPPRLLLAACCSEPRCRKDESHLSYGVGGRFGSPALSRSSFRATTTLVPVPKGLIHAASAGP